MEPSSNQPSKKLLEPWWNPRGTLPQNHPGPPCSPGGTLVEPYQKPPRPPRSLEPWRNPRETFLKPAALEEIGGTLVEPSWNLTSNHPRPLRPCRTWWNHGGTLVEPWWNHGGTLVEPWWNPGGTLVEPLWNPGGTLAQGRPEPPRSLSQSFQLLGKNDANRKPPGTCQPAPRKLLLPRMASCTRCSPMAV